MHIQYIFFVSNYLMSSQNRVAVFTVGPYSAQYSINNQAVLKHKVKQSCSQCMYKMSPISCKAGSQSLLPFPDCTVNHSLVKNVPLLLNAMAQLFHVLDLVYVNAVLQNSDTTKSSGLRSGPLGQTQ